MYKITKKMVVILFATLVALAFSQNAYGLSSLNITATTNKESYDIMEEIFVTGKLSQNGSIPVSDGLVTIQVDNPENNFFAIRTRTTGANLAGPWPVEILEIVSCDQGGNPKGSFKPGGNAGFKVTIKNNDPVAHIITVTLNVYDRYEAPFAALIIYSGSIGANGLIIPMIWPVIIPGKAPEGNAAVYANVLTQLPREGGFAYSPEKSATFAISKTTTTAFSATHTIYSASEEGAYNLTFRIGSGYGAKLGTHTVYVCSFYEIWLATNSTTFELVLLGDITGPEGVPDGIVDIDDIIFVAIRFGIMEGDPGWDPRADIAEDGLIDIDDVMFVALRFGNTL